MEGKTFLSPLIKTVLIFTIILLTGILLVVVGNPFKKAAAPVPAPSPILSPDNQSGISDFDNFISVNQEDMPKDLVSVFTQDPKGDTDQFCGQKQVTINDFEFISESIDLNGDGIKEFIITPGKICGDDGIRGASGNGPILIYQKINNSWTNISILEGNMYAVKQEKSDGYQKIVTYWHMSAGSGIITYYKWNSSKITYEEEYTKEKNLNNN